MLVSGRKHYYKKLTSRVLCVGDQRRRAECVDPVVVPERIQQPLVHHRLEVGDLERVVRLAVDAEILNLAQRDGLVFAGAVIWRLVACRKVNTLYDNVLSSSN